MTCLLLYNMRTDWLPCLKYTSLEDTQVTLLAPLVDHLSVKIVKSCVQGQLMSSTWSISIVAAIVILLPDLATFTSTEIRRTDSCPKRVHGYYVCTIIQKLSSGDAAPLALTSLTPSFPSQHLHQSSYFHTLFLTRLAIVAMPNLLVPWAVGAVGVCLLVAIWVIWPCSTDHAEQ
jgi:hypothetical protein